MLAGEADIYSLENVQSGSGSYLAHFWWLPELFLGDETAGALI
jgi:hypothetical protein